MQIATVCFLVTNTQVLLGVKQEGVGRGLLNGPGGRAKPGESPEHTTVREIDEEIRVKVEEADLEKTGVVTFHFDKQPKFEVHIFLVRQWQGEPTDTGEMKELKWYDLGNVPVDDMMPADKRWVQLILSGKKIKGQGFYNHDASALEDFRYEETSFTL